MNTATKTKPRAKSKSEQRRHAEMKKPVKTAESVVVTMLLDESGSMVSVLDATISGFNEYVGTLKRDMAEQRVYFSAVKFDTEGVRKLQVGVPICDAVTLGRHNYRPNSGTPLLDAVGKTLRATEDVVAKHDAKKVIVVIQTDGAENASVEFTLAEIKAMIEAKQAKGWQIMFIGAGINAFADGVKYGITGANTMSYGKDRSGTIGAFRATAANSAMFASGEIKTMNYNATQSLAAGEDLNITRAKLNTAGASSPPPVLLPSTPISALSLVS
jgi:Mg-chelatase subunit ChlD